MPTSETLPDGTIYTFAYDNHNNLISATDPTGTTTFTYDSDDRLTEVAYPDHEFLKYTYNSAGQRAQMVDQTGFTVDYQYNALGQLGELSDGSGNLIVAYSYDAVGRLASEQFGNGTSTIDAYDAGGDVTSITNKAPDGSVQSEYAYTYDNIGLPATETTPAGSFDYGYNADGELTSVEEPGGATITYQYDAAGNRVAEVDNGVTSQYTANSLNEYTSVGGATDSYDANGNLISQTSSSGTTTYSYNALGELTQVVSPSAGVTTYQYDALGYLVAQDQNGKTTENLIDPVGAGGLGDVVGQFDNTGSTIAQYAYGLGLVSQVSAAGTSAYYNFDLTGDTTALTGAGGTVLDSYTYLPFGQLFSSTGDVSNPFTFVGQSGVMDGGNGLYFMRNRWYGADLGRFLSPDPSGINGGTTNLYKYANNSPTQYVDPSGLDTGEGEINQGLTTMTNFNKAFISQIKPPRDPPSTRLGSESLPI